MFSAPTSARIFAGGRATRLGGVDKALLSVGGRPIVDRVVDALTPLVDECLVLTNDQSLAGHWLPIVQSAARALRDVATFDSAGVTEK